MLATSLLSLAFFAPMIASSRRLVPMRSYLRLTDFCSTHLSMPRTVWHYTQHMWLESGLTFQAF